ncbi:hypothetical protein T261_07360 [Streptomyces lydicus]|nr:hypothetical protein T261_07360 [Streptomyces lydicus]
MIEGVPIPLRTSWMQPDMATLGGDEGAVHRLPFGISDPASRR